MEATGTGTKPQPQATGDPGIENFVAAARRDVKRLHEQTRKVNRSLARLEDELRKHGIQMEVVND